MKKLINIMLAALIALALPCTANGVNAEQQQRKTTAAKKTTTQRKKTTTARKPRKRPLRKSEFLYIHLFSSISVLVLFHSANIAFSFFRQ